MSMTCASASADGIVKLWDFTYSSIQSDQEPSQDDPVEPQEEQNQKDMEEEEKEDIQSKKPRIHAGSETDTLRIRQELTPLLTWVAHIRGINDIAWSPCGSLFKNSLDPLKIRIGEGKEAKEREDEVDFASYLNYSITSSFLATASDDNTLGLWDITHITYPNKNNPNHVAVGNGNRHPTTIAPTTTPTTTYSAQPLVHFKGHHNFCFSVKFHPQGNILASGSFDETVKLWDVRSGSCIMTLPAHSDPVTCIDFNYDGTCLVTSSYDGLIRVWDVATGQCLKTLFYNTTPILDDQQESDEEENDVMNRQQDTKAPNETGTSAISKNTSSTTCTTPPVGFVKCSPNGKYVLSGTLDGKLRLSDITQRYNDSCTAATTHRNSTSIFSSSLTSSSLPSYPPSSLPIHDSAIATTGRLCTKIYSGHVNTKHCIFGDFMIANPKWQGVVTGSEDGKIYIYDLQRQHVKQVLHHESDGDTKTETATNTASNNNSGILAVASHPKIELLASGGMTHDKTVRFWAPDPSRFSC